MGPEGPLVRFDRSSLSLLFSTRRERGFGDRRRRTAAPHGHLRAGMERPDWGGPLGGSWVVGGGRNRRRRAPRRRGLRVRSGFWAPVVSDRGWVVGQLRKDKRKLLVALVGRESDWLRRIAPELGGGRAGRR